MCEPDYRARFTVRVQNAARGQCGQADKTYTSNADKNACPIVWERGQSCVPHSPSADKKTCPIYLLTKGHALGGKGNGERGGHSPIEARGRQRSASTAQRSPSGNTIERTAGRLLARALGLACARRPLHDCAPQDELPQLHQIRRQRSIYAAHGSRRTMTLRPCKCPRCSHSGGIPSTLPTTAKLKCSACGAKMLARHAIGDRPCPLRTPSRETELKRKAAADAIARLGDNPLNDSLADLFTTEDE
jgi:hypothetical protein